MVGHLNESKIFMNGLETRALIKLNTGSMVTCMSEKGLYMIWAKNGHMK